MKNASKIRFIKRKRILCKINCEIFYILEENHLVNQNEHETLLVVG